MVIINATQSLNNLINRIDDVAYIDKLLERVVTYHELLCRIPEQKLNHKQKMWRLKYVFFESQISGISTDQIANKLIELLKSIPK